MSILKSINERTYYDILDLNRNCSTDEVERAYHVAKSAYGDGSMASYSLYGADDLEVIRQKVDEAYLVLVQEESRRVYDESLQADVKPQKEKESRLSDSLPSAPNISDIGATDRIPYNGSRLRRIRLESGTDLERISEITKIRSEYLLAVEEDRYDDLPSPVYVRGFVHAYARCLGVDADRAASEYLERMRLKSRRGNRK